MRAFPLGAVPTRRRGRHLTVLGALAASVWFLASAASAHALVHNWSCVVPTYAACWDVNEYHSWKTIDISLTGYGIVDQTCGYAITSNNAIKQGSGCSWGTSRLSCVVYPFDPYSRPYGSWTGPNQPNELGVSGQAITASEATC
jgi:hypothetical protein